MKRNLIYKIILFTQLIFVFSCIDDYKPDIKNMDSERIVVNGNVTDKEGFQKVYISKTSSTDEPEYIPFSNCDVKIIDSKGNKFQLQEGIDGEYSAFFEQKYLEEKTAYMVSIVTPDGQIINSEFDTLYNCPEIDSIYYEQDKIPGTDLEGIQFYTDYNGLNSTAGYIRWDLTETYEYHAQYPRRWVLEYNGLSEIDPPNYTLNVCWATQKVLNIYTLSTNELVQNKYKKYPLNFVDNTTQRLAYGYSLLVDQYALSKQAYEYFQKLQTILNKEGGLYSTQPFSVNGNLINETNPEEKVLGVFYAGGMRSKRIFVDQIEDLPLDFDYHCGKFNLAGVGFRAFGPDDYPVYLWMEDGLYWIKESCYDCRHFGGTLTAPDYWPN